MVVWNPGANEIFSGLWAEVESLLREYEADEE
jgi:hypothetical protein